MTEIIKKIKVGFDKTIQLKAFHSDSASLEVEVETNITPEELDQVYDRIFERVKTLVVNKLKEERIKAKEEL